MEQIEPRSSSIWTRPIQYLAEGDFVKCTNWLVSAGYFAKYADANRYLVYVYQHDVYKFRRVMTNYYESVETGVLSYIDAPMTRDKIKPVIYAGRPQQYGEPFMYIS